jgi:prepilin-type N-terminal cleavage/methylation domain-containing protein
MWLIDAPSVIGGDCMTPSAPVARPARYALLAQEGMTMIEVLAALSVLAVGILGTAIAFQSSQRLSLVSERHATMAQIAQREIERIEGLPYSQVELTTTPSTSTDPTNPDYYVTPGSPPTFQWDRTGSHSEPVDVDSVNGTVQPLQSWSEVAQGGTFSGQIYDFVTWATDPKCWPGCPASQDYKRITIAVTMSSGLQPTPVYVSSVLADPQALPIGGISNGTSGNPLKDPTTQCSNASGQIVACIAGINQGNPHQWFFHDCLATSSSCSQPSANHPTHPTVGAVSGLLCTTSQTLALSILADIAGCPTPDLMSANPPQGTSSTPGYNYSTDQCASNCGYPAGRLLQPDCGTNCAVGGVIGSGSGGGTDSASDCSDGAWTSTLPNAQREFWVGAPLAAQMTLNGNAGVTVFTQTLNGIKALVSFCIEIYDVRPSGSAGSLADLLAWPPVALGGSGYVAVTDPTTGSNWPQATSDVSFDFNFRGSSGPVTIPAGDRIGVMIWIKATTFVPIALLYDNPNFASQVQLNSQ